MNRLYGTLAWGMIALGLLHVWSAPRTFTPATLWFASGGLAIMLTGALNLLNRSYGSSAAGLRRVCIGVNAVMVLFALLSGIVNRATASQLVIVLGLFGGAGAFSAIRRALLPSSVVR
jgi:hypothetical protein